jgi:hypothetical protein
MMKRRPFVGRFLALVAGSTLVAGAVSSASANASPPRTASITASHRVFMVSDSVGLGAVSAMKAAFPAGWQVTVTGKPAQFVEQLVSRYVVPELVKGAYGNAIVAGGYNYPYWDPPRFARSVDLMVDTLVARGVQHVFWMTMREVKPEYFAGWAGLGENYKTLYRDYPTANGILRAALARHSQLSLIDWASASDQVGLTYDAIHLNTAGAKRYSALAAGVVTSAATRLPAGTISTVKVAGVAGVPADATAVSLQLTVSNPRTVGGIVVWPCGRSRPAVANLGFQPGQTVTGAAIVGVGSDGSVCVYQSADAHVSVDRYGAFTAGSGFRRVLPWSTTKVVTPSARLVARVGAATGSPKGPFLAVVSLSGLSLAADTDLRVVPCGAKQPPRATVTLPAGGEHTVFTIAPTDSSGNVCITSTARATVRVSVFGAFPSNGAARAIWSRRLVDTRLGATTPAGAVVRAKVAALPGIPALPTLTGALIQVTMWQPSGIGTAAVSPCSSIHRGESIAALLPNHPQTGSGFVWPGTSGDVCFWSSVSARVTIDVTGWTGTGFIGLTPLRAFSSIH